MAVITGIAGTVFDSCRTHFTNRHCLGIIAKAVLVKLFKIGMYQRLIGIELAAVKVVWIIFK